MSIAISFAGSDGLAAAVGQTARRCRRRGFAVRSGVAMEAGGGSAALDGGDARQSTGHCSTRIALALTAIVSVNRSATAETQRANDSSTRDTDGHFMLGDWQARCRAATSLRKRR